MVSQSDSRLNLRFQGGLLKASTNSNLTNSSVPRGGRRGAVTVFSPASRKRLFEKFASLHYTKMAIFITLTYGQSFPSPQQAKSHLRAFLERMRRAAPGSSAIWRIEFQERGAPHFHLVCFNLPFYPKDDLAVDWLEVVGNKYGDWSSGEVLPPFTRIERIHSRKKLFAYVSKYVAKLPNEEISSSASLSDDISVFGDYEQDSNSDADECGGSGFNNGAYLHVGRWWGVFNKDHLPIAELVEMSVGVSLDAYLQFRRAAKRYWKGCRTNGKVQGFTLFCEDAQQWANYWLYLKNLQ